MSPHHDDGREEALQQYIRSLPQNELRNNPSAVLDAIDRFTQQHHFLMTLGPHKLGIIRDMLWKVNPKPKVVVELGTYLGYSAIAFSAMVEELWSGEDLGSVKVYSMELDPRWAKIAQDLVDLAGVGNLVEIITGEAASSIKKLKDEGRVEKIDVLLLDHWEDFYVSDLQVCEDLGMFRKGSLILADNCLLPGAPDYLKYVKGGGRPGKVRYESEDYHTKISNEMEDILEASTVVETFQ